MPTLTATEIQQAREYYNRTLNRVADVTKGVSEEQLRFKPGPDRWSIAQTLEHMVLIEERIISTVLPNLSTGAAPAPDRDNDVIETIVYEKVPDRTKKARPPFPEPAGDWKVQDALDRMARNYDGLTAFLESTPDARNHVLDAPPIKFITDGAHDTLDGYQWAITVAAHDQRHVEQILEVKADPNYPAALNAETAAVA